MGSFTGNQIFPGITVAGQVPEALRATRTGPVHSNQAFDLRGPGNGTALGRIETIVSDR